ncbi:MAG: hypothetical protein WEB58_18335 [Planctomycetaceae bacterium]
MADKILGVVCFVLCAASQVFIRHDDTALFFSALFFVLGAYEFIIGDLRLRRMFQHEIPPSANSMNAASVGRHVRGGVPE